MIMYVVADEGGARIWLRVGTLATGGGRDTADANGIPATPIELSWVGGYAPTLAHAKKARTLDDR
jgi:hypothetical protein